MTSNPPPHPHSGPQRALPEGLAQDLTELGVELAGTLGALIEAIPGKPERAMDLARLLGLNKDVAARMVRAIGLPDPLAVVHGMPGPEPLSRIIRAAADLDVRPELIDRARRAVDRFEALIRTEAGDRGTLDAMISAWLPEAREKQELAAKQLVFRGMTVIRGVSSETNLSATFVHPSATDPTRADIVGLFGTFGLRRVHPGATVRLGSRLLTQSTNTQRLTLAGEPFHAIEEVRLDAFCSRPLIKLEARQFEDRVLYTLGPGAVGGSAAANVLLAEYQPAAMTLQKAPGTKRGDAQFMSRITYPLRRLVIDLLIHPGLFRGAKPQAVIYDTISAGAVNIEDESREIDRLALSETVTDEGSGVEAMRCAEIPRYTEMLKHVCTMRGWDPSAFRGYRCLVDYPAVGTQISLLLPREDAAG